MTCDKCGTAVVAVTTWIGPDNTLVLEFCGHCTHEYAPALLADGWAELFDSRNTNSDMVDVS